jgi:5-methylcytosine-specific restriction endonuclease McrA
MNRWSIPDWLEQEVIERDRSCIYCGVVFGLPEAGFRSRPSWEHIINDDRIITRENIALCCRSCNSSKGVKPLAAWLDAPYCKKRNISKDTVAGVVKDALSKFRSTHNQK